MSNTKDLSPPAKAHDYEPIRSDCHGERWLRWPSHYRPSCGSASRLHPTSRPRVSASPSTPTGARPPRSGIDTAIRTPRDYIGQCREPASHGHISCGVLVTVSEGVSPALAIRIWRGFEQSRSFVDGAAVARRYDECQDASRAERLRYLDQPQAAFRRCVSTRCL